MRRPQSRPGWLARALPASLPGLVIAPRASTSVTRRVTNAPRQAKRSRAQETPQGTRAGEGLLGAQEPLLPLRQGAGRALARLRLPRPQGEEADVPAALDHPDQRRRAAARPLVQPVHRRAEGGG